jgi:hypothetical protein
MPDLRTLCVAMAIASAAAAALPGEADRAIPCRPTIACTADLVPPGTFEVEAGALYRRLPDSVGQFTSPLLLKLTMIKDLQLQVGTNGYTVVRGKNPANYLDDLTIGPKLHLLDQTDAMPALAISAQASIPTFQREGYLRTYDAFLTGYVTKDFGPVHNDTNVGVNFWRLEDAPLTQVFAASAFSMSLPPRWLQVMLEAYAYSDAAPVASRDGGVLFAFSETLAPWFVLDQGADLALFRSTRSYSLFVGFTVVPAVLWRPSAGRLVW